MSRMLVRTLALAGALAGMLLVACGGGSGDPEDSFLAGLTDPAAVPTVARGSDAILYRIAPDGSISTDGAAAAATPTGSPQGGTRATTYTVQSGDSCASIAAAFAITTAELIDANSAINDACTNLNPDQQIRIPGSRVADATPTPPATEPAPEPGEEEPPGETTYVLESGDFCGSIAAKFGVSLDDFLAVNGLDSESCTRLDVGDVVIIP